MRSIHEKESRFHPIQISRTRRFASAIIICFPCLPSCRATSVFHLFVRPFVRRPDIRHQGMRVKMEGKEGQKQPLVRCNEKSSLPSVRNSGRNALLRRYSQFSSRPVSGDFSVYFHFSFAHPCWCAIYSYFKVHE